MRRRITFVHGSDEAFNPDQLHLDEGALNISSLKGAREERITFGLPQLPQELWRVLKQCHELHIRWASPEYYRSTVPFVSRVSPGLHVFFTPQRNHSADLLCPILRKVFGDRIKCQSPEVLCLDLDETRIAAKVDFQETFSGLFLLSERFASSSSWQYHHLLPSLSDLIIYIEQNICSSTDQTCHSRATSLRAASYLDIDYDTISQVVVLSAFWHQPPNSDSWNERIQDLEGDHQVEVGVLASEKATEPEELSLGGFLTVIGEDDKPNPTLFSFPSRHHPLSNPSQGTYSSSFTSPTGLHPTLGLTFQTNSNTSPATTCALHAYLTLPSYLFADKYQLSDPLFLASKHLHSTRSISGETDLEAPDWAVKKWGSSMLVELSPPSPR
ncbi:MAG: protease B nonderepressible form, partial [Pleopsidium flavum]